MFGTITSMERKDSPFSVNEMHYWRRPKKAWLGERTRWGQSANSLQQAGADTANGIRLPGTSCARREVHRVSAEQMVRGAFLRSQSEAAAAQEMEAQTLLLQAQLEYIQAQDELNEAVGLAVD